MHALAAMLQNNPSITELNVRMNSVTDEGARALAAVLAGNSRLRTVDLRENHVGKSGVRAIAEALERSQRVRHVYVHAGGKIEALGTGMWAAPRGAQGGGAPEGGAAPGGGMMTVETVCAVDVRDNTEAPRTDDMAGGTFGLTDGGGGGGQRRARASPMRPETDDAGGGGGLGATNATRASAAPTNTKRKGKKASRKPKTSKEETAERKARREYKRIVSDHARLLLLVLLVSLVFRCPLRCAVAGARDAAPTRGWLAGPCWRHGRPWSRGQDHPSHQSRRAHWRVACAAASRHR